MYRLIASLLLTFSAAPVFADTCPSLFRFVDFGLEDKSGDVHRGGLLFRAFNADGTHLLHRQGTHCRSVDFLAKDGRALKIPVVSQINVDPELAGVEISTLRLTAVQNTTDLADTNATRHRTTQTKANAITTKGATFLCVGIETSTHLSCQITSPYTDGAPLVVYCDALTCNMPVLARDPHVNVSATWPRGAMDPAKTGAEASDKIKKIYGFLTVHS